MARDDFSSETIRKIGARAGWLCARCGAATVGAKKGDPSGVLNLGEAAHITAAAPGGKRYDASLTPDQRADHTNGIWLCRVCARLVDSDDNIHPVGLLQDWKIAAEDRSWQRAANKVAPFGPGPTEPELQQTEARLMAGAIADIAAFKTSRR